MIPTMDAMISKRGSLFLRRAGWTATHLLALGAGWWWAGEKSASGSGVAENIRPLQTRGQARQERPVSPRELIDAYNNPEFWSQARARRSGSESSVVRNGDPPVLTPAEQAAAVGDIAAALQKEIDGLNTGKGHDYMLGKALINRWMKENPKASAAWLGRMKSRIGWMDPFHAFAESLPPMEVLDLMDDDWLRANRGRALKGLAAHMGDTAVAGLPQVLGRLEKEEAARFLSDASSRARAEDAEAWLQVAGDDRQLLNGLARRWIDGSQDKQDDGWLRQMEFLLQAAAGTPAEEIFRARIEEQRKIAEGRILLASAKADPKQAFDGLLARAIADGHDPAEARNIASGQVESAYPGGIETWRQSEWHVSIQQSLAGSRSLEDALAERLDSIREGLPDPLQAAPRGATWSDALTVDAMATLGFAKHQGLLDEVIRSGATLAGQHDVSLAVKADLLRAFAGDGLWDKSRGLPDPKSFLETYSREDPAAAKAWWASLPQNLRNSRTQPSR